MNRSSELLIGQTISKLHVLPPGLVCQVADYVEFLQTKYRPVSPVGSPESLLVCWGKWQFTSEERAELDAYIQTSRELGCASKIGSKEEPKC